MGNLGDAFRKAGIISDRDYRQKKHQERIRRKELGHQGLQRETQAEEARREQHRQTRQAADRTTEARRRTQEATQAEAARARDLVRRHALSEGWQGGRRFHYLEPDGRLPYLLVNEGCGRRLESGEYAIALGGLLVPRTAATEAQGLDPAVILFLNG